MYEITLFPPSTAEQYIDLETYITQSIVDSIGDSGHDDCSEVQVLAIGYVAIVNNKRIVNPTLTPFWKTNELRFSAIDNGRAYSVDLYVAGTDVQTTTNTYLHAPAALYNSAKSVYDSLVQEYNGSQFGDDIGCAIGAFNRYTGPRGQPIYKRELHKVNSTHTDSTALRDGMTDYVFGVAKDLIHRLYANTVLDTPSGYFIKKTPSGDVVRTSAPRVIHIDASKHVQGKLGIYSVHGIHSARDATSPHLREAPIRTLSLKPNDIIVMVNSDYYYEKEDMEYLMSRCICLFVTLQPIAPSGVYGGNGTYTIHRGVCHAEVMGGAKYVHKLWDFNHSHLIIGANRYYDRLVTVEVSRVPGQICEHTAIVATFPGKLVRKSSCCFGRQLSGATLERYRTSIVGEGKSGHTADAIVFNGASVAEHPVFNQKTMLPRKLLGLTVRSKNISPENLNNDCVFVTLDNIAVTIEAYRRKTEADRAKDPASMVADTFEPTHISRRRTATYLAHTIVGIPYIDVTVVSPNSRLIQVVPGGKPVRYWKPRNYSTTDRRLPYSYALNLPYVARYHPECLAIKDKDAYTPAGAINDPPPQAPLSRPKLTTTVEHGCLDANCKGDCGQTATFQQIIYELTPPSSSGHSPSSQPSSGSGTVRPPLEAPVLVKEREITSDEVELVPYEEDTEVAKRGVRLWPQVCAEAIPTDGAACIMSNHGESYKHTVRVHPPLCTAPNIFSGTNVETVGDAVTERFVRKPRIETDDPSRRAWFKRKAVSFGKRILKELGGPISAISLCEVDEKMDKPTQRAATTDAMYCQHASVPHPTEQLNSFIKTEQVPMNKPARLIICRDPVKDPMRHGEARWALPMASEFKKFRWYAGGKSPEEIDQAVMECALRASNSLLPSDFKKFDASQQKLLAECFLLMAQQFVDPTEWKDFLDAYNAVGACKFNKNGTRVTSKAINGTVTFRALYEMMSGRNFTTFTNTLKQVFVHFCALTTEYEETRGKGACAHDWAWSKLGIYMGDDGITLDLSAQRCDQICAELGLALDAESIDYASDIPVPFLGRLFPRLFQGDSSSFYDIRRFLQKAGNYAENDLTAAEDSLILYAKGMSITDPETPIIKEYCQLVYRSFPAKRIGDANLKLMSEKKSGISNWLYHTLHYAGDGRTLPTRQARDDYLPRVAATGIDLQQLEALRIRLASTKTLGELELPPGTPVDLGNLTFKRFTVIGTEDGPRVYYPGEEYY